MDDSRQNTCRGDRGDRGGPGLRGSRREFLKGLGTVAATASTGVWPILTTPSQTQAKAKIQVSPETAVARLYDSLSDGQKKVICLPWMHRWRERFGANWAVTKPAIGEFFSADQQAVIREIFRGVTSEEGYERFLKQMDEDYGGFGRYHIAIFGEPGGDSAFEWVMSGRHLTIRCDGNFEDGTAFGGPMVYGHGTGDSKKGLPGNVFYYQTKRANEVFGMLDGKQRQRALLDKAPRETDVKIKPPEAERPGILVNELAPDQKQLVRDVMNDLLAPYREEDVKEAMACLAAGGGMDNVRMAFYKQNDLGSDGIWDIWRMESSTFVWHFRGAPHVHAYVNIKKGELV